jgi:hypothetical protein
MEYKKVQGKGFEHQNTGKITDKKYVFLLLA